MDPQAVGRLAPDLDGVGLGLALAKELVDAHGGTIAWEAADPGTVFVLSLPRRPEIHLGSG